ncbi:D-2-hydroxyacid dehydrogenase [uncultured Alsobacter sp.]|uniref:D-2-hydroxyacid dehydrogenase n=1 Tax=uncultured Alsobacter sp. TaxID=1748258 RepID=UPI0025D9BCE7|nr:D-2-hydroxyacid dehydrogenase [uncultured Alsobacter sp.]
MTVLLPPRDRLTIGFAHVAYRMADAFAARGTGIDHFQVGTAAELEARLADVDVLVCSFLWKNDYLARSPRLRFLQSISAGTDQYDKPAFAARGLRLASGQGSNEKAVAQHAMALLLALTRHLHLGRDRQAQAQWRPMIGDRTRREDELGGKTMAIVGFGRIGQRLAAHAKAFEMRVVGVRRDATPMLGVADAVLPTARLAEALGQADVVVLTCPLTPETTNLMDAAAFAALKPGAILINVARGKVVDEGALLAALASGTVSSAGLDCFHDEPLPATSPIWALPNVLVTPHSAGETRRYEDNVVDLLLENLDRLWAGRTDLVNGIV